MISTSHSSAESPVLERLRGAATPYGSEYEIFLGGLWALRAGSRGLSFQLFSNVAAARPVDDLVLRVQKPQPLTVFFQLKHANTTGAAPSITTQAFTSPKGDYSIQKYYEFYVDFESNHTTPGSVRTKDDELLHDCCLDDVRMVIYTNRPVTRRKGAADGPHLHFQHEDLLRTSDTSTPNSVFSFGYRDQEVWKLYDNDPRKDFYQQEFLPRLRVFSDQGHVSDVKDLIRQELDAMFGAPLPRSFSLFSNYRDILEHWALVDTRGAPLTERSGEVEWLVAEELAKQGRAAAGGGALRFQAEHCVALRRALGGGQGALAVRVRGVPAGHRAAKVVQVLDEAFAGRWAYVGDRQLRELPRAALEAACGAGHVQLLLLDAEEEVAAARALVAAVGCSVKVVAVSSGDGAGLLTGGVTMDEEDWRMDHLTLEAQDALMERTLHFQGRPVPLRALEPSWRSVRGDVDGALLSALVRGGAAMGAALPAPGDAHLDLPRTLEHPATLDPAVLEGLDPRSDHLVLSGFPAPFLENLYNTLRSKDVRSGKPESYKRQGSVQDNREKEPSDNDAAVENNKWWTVLPGAGGSSAQEAAFLRVAARAEGRGLNVHWLHCVGVGAVVWKATRGATQAVAPFVQRASDACGRAPACVHAAEAVRHAAAWRQRVGLLVGEPGMGKSRFLQRLAAEAAQRWAVLLQALDHRNLLRDFPQPTDLTQEHLVELLAAAAGVGASSSPESTQRFLKAALYDSGDIAVFVDGVDEICPSYKDKLVRLLEMLLETKARLVWVSSRPEAASALTKALRCATSTLRPFSEEEQKNHLCGHWSSVDPRNRPPAAFESLAAEMVAALHGAAGRGQRSLLDVPLHAQMAAEAYATKAARALGTGVSLLPQTGISLYQLYRRFVERKRDLFERRFGLKDANFTILPYGDNFEEVHQNCAMIVLVSDGTFSNVDSSSFRHYLDKNRHNLNKEKTGILWLGDEEDEMPHFLHYTFIEYFGACWLLENQEKGSEVAKEVWLRLLDRDVGVGVRHILEHMLSYGLPLHRAVLEGSEGALEAALEAGGDADESDRFGRTALVQAASLGRADAVGALLAKGCDPGRRDALLGWTALRYASACGHLEAAERLLRGGADPDHFVTHNVDIPDTVLEAAELDYSEILDIILNKVCGTCTDIQFQWKGTPVIIAAKCGHTKTVQILLKNGANMMEKDNCNRQPIHYAASGGKSEITKLLLESKADPNADDMVGDTPLMCAAKCGDVESTDLLLVHGADVSKRNKRNRTALHYATKKGHDRITKLLLESKADYNAVDKKGKTPLMLAAKLDHAKCTELLLQQGADVNQKNKSCWTALHYSTCRRHRQITKLLLEGKADPNAVDKEGFTPLMTTAEAGDAKSTALLLQHGANVNQCDNGQWTALHYASMRSHHQIAKLLLESKADPNAIDEDSVAPLMIAVLVGDRRLTGLLLKHGVDVNIRNKDQCTPLYYATKYRHNKIARLLLKSNADPNAVGKECVTPLMLAAASGDVQTAKLLLEHGADVNKRNIRTLTALYLATMNGHYQITKLLLECKADVNAEASDGSTPLMMAAEKGDVQTARLLLKCGVDVNKINSSNMSALYFATMNGHHEITKLLLENKADPNEVDEECITPLMLAAASGDAQTAKLLLEHGADVNKSNIRNMTALCLATMYDHHQTAKLLLEHGADVSQRTKDNWTALHYATENGLHGITKLLLEKKADPNARDENGITPLMMAATVGDEQSTQLLLDHGADVTQKTKVNRTALHYAVAKGRHEITKLLLERRADPNAVHEEGITPLMMAAAAGDAQCTELLLEHGADVSQMDKEHWTALHFATMNGHHEIMKLLLEMKAGHDRAVEVVVTPLMIAVWVGNAQSTQLLLDHGADVSQTDGEKWTALHYATMNGHLEIMNILLESKADPNSADRQGVTPLMMAKMAGDAQSMTLFLEHGADVKRQRATEQLSTTRY